MKCKNCGKTINFKHYLMESINPFKRMKHSCLHCGFKYKVNIFFWPWLIMLVMGLKSYKYYMQNTHFIYLGYPETTRLFIAAIALMYIIFIIEQVIYYIWHTFKDK